MNAVQVEQKSYEMPPREGFTVAHFLTVADVDRSARFYEKVFGGRILSKATATARPRTFRSRILAPCQPRGRADPRQADGNAQRPRPESHQQLYEYPRCGYPSVL
jgi:catechol 2,3-dioxygenase-like lactoylglutathione lyase family enzyme